MPLMYCNGIHQGKAGIDPDIDNNIRQKPVIRHVQNIFQHNQQGKQAGTRSEGKTDSAVPKAVTDTGIPFFTLTRYLRKG